MLRKWANGPSITASLVYIKRELHYGDIEGSMQLPNTRRAVGFCANAL